MSTNIVNKDTGELVTLANGTRMWIGTQSAHDLAVQQGTMPNNCMVCITNDYKNTMIGEMKIWCGSSASVPDGWLYCDGSAVSRTQYADLFAVIGTAFGSGDGSTTFNIPDMRESVPKGAGLTGNSSNHMDSDGLAVGEYIDDRFQYHSHRDTIGGQDNLRLNVQSAGGETRQLAVRQENNLAGYEMVASVISAGRYGSTTEVKSVGVNYIICYE